MMRHTRHTDVRRDAITQAWADHDRHVSADRDALLVEVRELRTQMAALQAQLVAGRNPP